MTETEPYIFLLALYGSINIGYNTYKYLIKPLRERLNNTRCCVNCMNNYKTSVNYNNRLYCHRCDTELRNKRLGI